MTTSVIVALYNGEKYIQEQLDSLKNQTLKIDEVLIYDDCSTDKSYEVVKRFIETNELDWHLKKNDINQGWKKTFIRGMTEASGDLLFPCDQDDIWHSDKIEIMTGILENNPNIYVLSGKPHRYYTEKINAPSLRITISEILNAISYRKFKSKNTMKLDRVKFSTDFMKCQPGCVLCARRKFFDDIIDEWFDEMPHDNLFVFYSKLLNHYYELDYEIIDQKMHHDSASNSASRTREGRMKQIMMEKNLISGLISFAEKKKVDQDYLRILRGVYRWITYRYELVVNRKFRNAFPLLRYMKYYTQYRRFITDCVYCFK